MGTFLGTKRPLVIAHRGSSKAAPEMTMAAYLQATQENADGYECDVRLTKDLFTVCVHDNNLSRTSNGIGRIGAKTLAELKKLDFGSWFGAKPDQFTSEQWCSLITLDELLSYVAAQPNAPIVLVETKHRTDNGLKLEAETISSINKHGLNTLDSNKPRAALMSFSIPALLRAKKIDPNLYTVYLLDKKPLALSNLVEFVGANALGLGKHVLRANPEVVEIARSAGKQVFVWTVDAPEDIELCLKYKVDAIITNKPLETRTFINSTN